MDIVWKGGGETYLEKEKKRNKLISRVERERESEKGCCRVSIYMVTNESSRLFKAHGNGMHRHHWYSQKETGSTHHIVAVHKKKEPFVETRTQQQDSHTHIYTCSNLFKSTTVPPAGPLATLPPHLVPTNPRIVA